MLVTVHKNVLVTGSWLGAALILLVTVSCLGVGPNLLVNVIWLGAGLILLVNNLWIVVGLNLYLEVGWKLASKRVVWFWVPRFLIFFQFAAFKAKLTRFC